MDEEAGTVTPESSTSQDSQTDATPGSSAPQGEAGGSGSPPDHGGKKPTLSEALDKVQLEEPEEAGEGEETQPEGETPGTPASEADADEGEAGPDGAAGSKDGQPAADGKAKSSLELNFSKRPEWQGVLKLVPQDKRSEAIKVMRPVFEENRMLTANVERLRPAAKLVQEFRQYAGDDQGFETMRTIIRQYATDPAASVPVLEQMLEDARGRAGLVVTSADLKQRLAEIDAQVADGGLSEDVAAKWKTDVLEAEKSRAKSKQASQQVQQQTQQQRAAAAQAEAKARENALNAWEAEVSRKDPSFGEVTDVNDPEHGKSLADEVFDGLTLYFSRSKDPKPADLVKEANRLLALAKSRRGQPVRQQRVVTSDSSSTTAKRKPTSVMDAMNQVKLD